MTTEHTTDESAKGGADSDIARKIWLAGVGAYGRIYAETQGAVEKLAATASETFDELVVKGEEMEDRVRKTLAKSPQVEKVAQAVESATAKAQSQRAALEARIDKVRETVSETLAPWNLPAIGQALEKLSVQVEALTAEVAALKAVKARDAAAEL